MSETSQRHCTNTFLVRQVDRATYNRILKLWLQFMYYPFYLSSFFDKDNIMAELRAPNLIKLCYIPTAQNIIYLNFFFLDQEGNGGLSPPKSYQQWTDKINQHDNAISPQPLISTGMIILTKSPDFDRASLSRWINRWSTRCTPSNQSQYTQSWQAHANSWATHAKIPTGRQPANHAHAGRRTIQIWRPPG